MSTIVFVGPTLPAEEASSILDAEFRGPASHGDIYRAASQQSRPRVIGLIDGYFQSVPAVRHKEILWAMSHGVHVFGAASLGALRAAELHDFGMVGVGRIFDAYREGLIEDDDEVAVEHAPVDARYISVCDAMVDIRATLERANFEGIIRPATRDGLLGIAKQIFYKRRSYTRLLEVANGTDLPGTELANLREWLPRGRIEQKREDAVAMLRAIQDFLVTDPPPLEVSYRFERAEIWEQDIENAVRCSHTRPDALLSGQAIMDELRLIPGEYAKARRDALAFVLALREAGRIGLKIGDDELRKADRALRNRHRITNGDQLATWLAENYLDEDGRDELVALQARVDSVEAMCSSLIDRCLVDVLRVSGRYAELVERARRKLEIAESQGWNTTSESGPPIPAFDLLLWYFLERLHQQPPLDIDEYASEQGFPSTGAFYRALAFEYLLSRHDGASN